MNDIKERRCARPAGHRRGIPAPGGALHLGQRHKEPHLLRQPPHPHGARGAQRWSRPRIAETIAARVPGGRGAHGHRHGGHRPRRHRGAPPGPAHGLRPLRREGPRPSEPHRGQAHARARRSSSSRTSSPPAAASSRRWRPCARPGPRCWASVSIFTYGMEKGKKRLAEANVRTVSLTDFDEIVARRRGRGLYSRAHACRGSWPSATNPSDESWMGGSKMRHLIDILDLSTEEITGLLDQADEIIAHPEDYRERCKYKKLATLFFEPSTRTRLSFEAAMLRAGRQRARLLRGGQLLRGQGRERGGHRPRRRLLRRHHRHASPQGGRAAWWRPCTRRCPIINAGDGGHNHPTQTLTDLLTIRREQRQPRQLHHRPVRRPQVRPHGALAHRGALPQHGRQVRAHLPGGAASCPATSRRTCSRPRACSTRRRPTSPRSCPSSTSST